MVITIFGVDDDRSSRGMVDNALSKGRDLDLIGDADNGVEAARAGRELHPDFVLMKAATPRINARDATWETSILTDTRDYDERAATHNLACRFIAKRPCAEFLPVTADVMEPTKSQRSNRNPSAMPCFAAMAFKRRSKATPSAELIKREPHWLQQAHGPTVFWIG